MQIVQFSQKLRGFSLDHTLDKESIISPANLPFPNEKKKLGKKREEKSKRKQPTVK